MYTSFSIENFRLFDQLTVEPLARVNLVAGQNNAGKTALLEAIWLHSGPNIPDLGIRLAGFRGIPTANPNRFMHDLFFDFDHNRAITLRAGGNWNTHPRILTVKSQPRAEAVITTATTEPPIMPPRGSQDPDAMTASASEIVLNYVDEHGVRFESAGWWLRANPQMVNVGPNVQMALGGEGMATRQAKMTNHPSCVFLSARHRAGPEEDVQRFGEVELEGYADRIVQALQVVDPRIKRLSTIAAPPMPMVYADVGLSRLLPMGFLGDGMGRLLSMVLAFHQARGGSILIDEVENGLHHRTLEKVWTNLDWLSRQFNVQVFATTHSYECIVAANNAFTELESDELHLHHLYRRSPSEPVRAMTYTKKALNTNIEYFWELR